MPFEPTEREKRVANWVFLTIVALGFVVLVLTNVSGSWWPRIVGGLVALALLGTMTAWIARNRDQSIWSMQRQLLRRATRRDSG